MVAVLAVAATCLAPNNTYGSGNQYYGGNSNFDEYSEKIDHPAIIGRAFPVNISKRKLVIEGAKAKSIEIELTSSSGNWELEVK